MKKIAILNCLKANEVCTGAACLKAYHERKRAFARYEKEEVELAAFWRCNGCGKDPETDPGLQEKMERLCQEGITVVHAGVCTRDREGRECPVIRKILSMLEEKGMEIVRGTH